MFVSRDSDTVLSSEEILSRVSEIDIFRRYCPGFVKIRKKFRSPLRNDPRPSVTIDAIGRDGHLRYTDYGHTGHSFNVFGFVMELYGISFREALHRVDSDFGLGLSGGIVAPVLLHRQVHEKPPTSIQVRTRQIEGRDLSYWGQFCLYKEDIIAAGVIPITHYWINGYRFEADRLAYVYTTNAPSLKIYSPLSEDAKWWSNTSNKDVQLWHMLPKKGRRVIIASSLKDALCLIAIGVPAIALSAESVKPSLKLIEDLRRRFSEVVVLYDNDPTEKNPGQRYASTICAEFNLRNIRLPDHPILKDVADWMEAEGPVNLRRLIDEEDKKEQVREPSEGEIPF